MRYTSAAMFCIFCAVGCTSRTVSNTPRTAIEQLLLSTAVDKALSKVQVPELAGEKAYLDFSDLRAYDGEYVESAFRACVAKNGLIVVEETDEADYTVRVSSGGLGNEYKEFLLGIPALPVPGSPMTLPEVALFKAVEQDGIFKLFVVFYADGKLVSANHYYDKVERDETFFLWMRFQPKDDIRKAWEEADAIIEKESN